MLKLTGVCLAVFLALSPPGVFAADPAAAPMAVRDMAAQIDAAVSPYYKADAPGAAVIVVKDGKVVFRKAYGLADVAHRQPMTPDMSLRLGSITKQFTSAAILMLVEEGRLSLTDDLTKFFPDYPAQGKKVTVEHLLTHTSGIASYTSKPGFNAHIADDLTVQGVIDSFKNDPLEFEPGTRWRYNNSGYFLLGAIIEKISGLRYPKFVEQRIFVPLGMTHTAYEGHERSSDQHATGHSPDAERYAASRTISMTQVYAAGALVSTVDDMARWDAAIADGRLLTPASWQRAFTAYRLASGESTAYGYGWETGGKVRGVPTIAHGGRVTGFRSFALRVPDNKVYVAVLTNADGGLLNPDVVAGKAAAIAIGKPYPERKAIALSAQALDALAGVFQADKTDKRTFRRVDDHLVMQRSGRPAFTLAAFSETEFFFPDSLDWVEFSRNGKGEVTQVILHQAEGEQQVNPRIGDVPASRIQVKIANAAFDERAGHYELAPNMVLELSREGDRFFAQPTGQRKIEIFASGEHTFFANAVDAELRFEPGPAGVPNGLVMSQGGHDMKGRKLY